MRIIRLNDVKKATGLAGSTIYKYIKAGLFPAPIPLGLRAKGWVESEVTGWIMEKIQERDGCGSAAV